MKASFLVIHRDDKRIKTQAHKLYQTVSLSFCTARYFTLEYWQRFLQHSTLTDEVRCVLYTGQTALTRQDLLESGNGVLEVDVLALWASEHLSHLEWLGKESLHFPGTWHSQLVLLRQLIHTQDSNDVLQRLEVLKKRQSWLKIWKTETSFPAVVWCHGNYLRTVLVEHKDTFFKGGENWNKHYTN